MPSVIKSPYSENLRFLPAAIEIVIITSTQFDIMIEFFDVFEPFAYKFLHQHFSTYDPPRFDTDKRFKCNYAE